MALLLAMLAGWQEPTEVDVIGGLATYYAEGVMQQVIENRRMPYYDGVALNESKYLDDLVWLQWGNGDITGPLPVVDCAQEAHIPDRESKDYVVEVSADVAVERGFYRVGPVTVIVWFKEPHMRWN